jgi:DNA-3-methyladenine glycosylase II
MNSLTDEPAFNEALACLSAQDQYLRDVIAITKPKPIRARKFIFSSVISTIIDRPGAGSHTRSIFKHIQRVCGGAITAESISKLTDEQLSHFGLSHAKIRYIRAFQSKVLSDEDYIASFKQLSYEEAYTKLQEIDGVNGWETKILLLYFFQHENIYVYDDPILTKSIKYLYGAEPTDFAKIVSRWDPYKSVACVCLWRWMDRIGTKLLGAEP